MSAAPLDPERLRAEVRAVLRDVLPAALLGAAGPGATPDPAAGVAEERVTLRTDADLDAFVRRLLTLVENPAHLAELRAGRRRFTLAPAGTGAVPGGHPGGGAESGAVHRVERGAVTERQVKAAAEAGARLVVGRRAVLTPLARDAARARGVHVERER
jgi:hypothetical protein